MVTTASPTQTIQEGNQKGLRLLVTSSPISNDNGPRFAPKSLLDAAIKFLSAPAPLIQLIPNYRLLLRKVKLAVNSG